jgi:DNA primase small subunit
MARKEIVDFLMGIGLESNLFGFVQGEGPRLDDSGWKGRIAKGTYEFLLIATVDELENAGLKKKTASQLIHQREKILESWKEKGPWKLLKGVKPESWEKIIKQAIEKQSVKIDTVVTTDIHRLIRLANTLHGETGDLTRSKALLPLSMTWLQSMFQTHPNFGLKTTFMDPTKIKGLNYQRLPQ